MLHASVLNSFLLLSSFLLYESINLFIFPLSMATTPISILEIMKKAAMNKPFCEQAFCFCLFFLGKYLRRELLGS